MNPLVLSLAWCWMQVFIVAGLTIALAALAMRRSPTAGAAIATAGVIAILALTVLAPIPRQPWAMANRSVSALSASTTAPSSSATTLKSSALLAATNDPSARFTVRAELFRDVLVSLERSQSVVVNQGFPGRVVLGIVAASVLLSLARVMYGLWTIMVLCRSSCAVPDGRLAAVMAELQPRLGLRWLPQVRECSALVSAAVVGWWRPSVMLPLEWRDWSPAELAAVLAHELAHVVRRDSLLRLVAVVTTALHCAQPLAYWLRWQLMLAQELAADELAARAVGGRIPYLHALTRLALRQDSRPNVAPAHVLLPVFSGFLLRRIEMLRAQDGSTRRGLQALLQWSAIATLVVVTIIATAIRGLAQPPDANADESIRVAKANDLKARPTVVAAEQPQPAAPFQRPPFDPASLAMGESGGFLIRLGEILGRADFDEPSRALDEWFRAGWLDAFPAADPPAWSLREIEHVAGDFQLTIKRLDQPSEQGKSNAVMFGFSWLSVRWQKPLARQFEEFRRIPGTVEKSHHDRAYLELPLIPALGPTKPCVCQVDEHTLLYANDEDGFRSRLDKLSATATPPTWNKVWKAAEGGAATAVATPKLVGYPFEASGEPGEKLMSELFTHSRHFAIGLDWQEPAGEPGVLRIHFRCESEEAAGIVRSSLRGLIDGGITEIRKVAETADAKAQIAAPYLESLQQAKIETHAVDDGWQVDVRFAGPVDIQWLSDHL